MGYVVLHLDKSPDNEVPMTAHIARTKMPSNAISELTYLNEELVEFPEGVADRTEAINHRLEHAGLTRKIGTNQVRVIRVMLTGTQEDMQCIVQEGRLKRGAPITLHGCEKLSEPRMSFRQYCTWMKQHPISMLLSFPS